MAKLMEDYIEIIGAITAFITLATLGINLFKSHWTSSEITKNPFTYYVLLINLVLTSALPVQLWLEFNATARGQVFMPFRFYCKYYPHLVIYPPLLFGFAALFVMRGAMLRWATSRKAVLVRVCLAITFASFILYYETTGGYLMLLEFNKEAQSATGQFEAASVRRQAEDLGIGQAFESPMAQQVSKALTTNNGKSKIAKSLSSFVPWSKFNIPWKSRSRILYLTIYWYMSFVMLLGYSLIPTPRMSQKRDSSLTLNLAGALIIFMMWFPFRIYYNTYTKIPLFGRDLSDNFLGISFDLNLIGLTASDIVPILTFLVFVFFLLLRAAELSRYKSFLIIAVLAVGTAIGSIYLAIYKPIIFASVYGLDGNIRYFIFRTVALFLLLLFTYDFLNSRIDDTSNDLTRLDKN